MGTRNLTIVKQGGTYKVGQYCQWDGYPEGQGARVFEFLNTIKTKKAQKAFAAKVAALTVASQEYVSGLWEECGADPKSSLVSMDISDKFAKKYPQFHRDFGARILAAINDGSVTAVQADVEFAKDSLFCEWAYLIDFDEGVVEVYKGFNTRPLTKKARFYFDGYKSDPHEKRDKDYKVIPGEFYHYYPIRLKKSYPLNKIPSVKQFLADMGVKPEKA